MASEIRIRCFLGDTGSRQTRDHRPDLSAEGRNAMGDNTQVVRSLTDLLEQLESDAGEYLVKVVVHRKLGPPVPSVRSPGCLSSRQSVAQTEPLRATA